MSYIPGLDGLRAVAVVAVLLYHSQDITGLSAILTPEAGFLGVEMFFVISGFLITALLLQEHTRSGRIGIKDFWLRRARRLLPALYVFLGGTTALAALFGTDALDKIKEEILGAVFYASNWLLLANDQSYFEAAGRPSLLRHLWSLAIEEQFYLLWPLVVIVALRVGGRKLLGGLTVAAIAGSTFLMWRLFDGVEQFGDVTAVYFRTDARAAALLLGALLAVVWRPWEGTRASHNPSPEVRWIIDVLGLCAIAFAVYLNFAFTDRVVQWDTVTRLYHGGFLTLSAATVIAIAAVSIPGSQLGAALGNPVFRWIGLRSYGLYLWHWPIFQLTRPRLDVDIDGYTLLGIRLAITVVAVELSYQLVERPIREGRFVSSILGALRTPRGIALGTSGALALIGLVVGLAVALPTIDRSPRAQTVEISEQQTVANLDESIDSATGTTSSTAIPNPTPAATSTTFPTATATPDPTPTVDVRATPAPSPQVTPAATPDPTDPPALSTPETSDSASATPPPLANKAESPQLKPLPTPVQEPLPPPPPLDEPFDIGSSQIHIVGDSVVEGAQYQLVRISPRVTVDGRLGRQWWELGGELVEMRSQGLGNDVVIIQLGNNGDFTPAMFDGVMRALEGTRLVLFINVHAPVHWEADVNNMLIHSVNRYPERSRLLDWYSASIDHPEYFTDDGTHLQHAGIIAFSQLIESSLVELG